MAGGPNNNIFLTTENLAFAFPLILVCSIYAYFKYVPLHIALSILAVLFVILQVRSTLKSNKDKKLVTMDDDIVKDLLGEEDELKMSEREKEEAIKQRKAKTRLEMRLAAERKQQNKQQKKKKGATVKEDEEGDALMTFAKGSRDTKKKK